MTKNFAVEDRRRRSWFWINHDEFYIAKSNPTAFVVYCYLSKRVNDETQMCHPPMGDIKNDLGLSEPTIKRSIKFLKQSGLVSVSPGHGRRHTVYKLLSISKIIKNEPSEGSPMTPPGVVYEPSEGSPMTPPGVVYEPSIINKNHNKNKPLQPSVVGSKPLGEVINLYKTLHRITSPDWDKANWGRAAKTAKLLIAQLGSSETVCDFLEQFAAKMESKGLSWTLETAYRWAYDYKPEDTKPDVKFWHD